MQRDRAYGEGEEAGQDRYAARWAAVAITGLLAYSQGFEITVTRLIRPGVPGMDEDLPLPRDTPAGRRALADRLMDQHYFQISFAALRRPDRHQ